MAMSSTSGGPPRDSILRCEEVTELLSVQIRSQVQCAGCIATAAWCAGNVLSML